MELERTQGLLAEVNKFSNCFLVSILERKFLFTILQNQRSESEVIHLFLDRIVPIANMGKYAYYSLHTSA